MTCAILSNLLHPLEDLHVAALSLAAPPLLQLGLITRIMNQPCGGEPYPTLDLREISAMTVSANKDRIQRADNFGPIPTQLCALGLYSLPLLSPTLNGSLKRDLLMQSEIAEMILGTGVLNGIIDDTIVLNDGLMSGRGLSTTDVTRLINVVETTVVSMITRILVVLRLLSTGKVTIVLPGPMVDGQQLPALRITNNYPLRMAEMTDGCHHHPPLL